ncbi:MAG: PaaI family thioesterase [Geminicoccaceae bacterium]
MSAGEAWTRVKESFDRQGIMGLLGAELVEVGAGTCTIALPWRPELTQQDGFFHAGAVATVADSAAGYAALTLMPPGSRVLSVEFKLNLMAPARGQRIVATGTVERAGRTLSTVRSDIVAWQDGEPTRVALLLATMICIRE